MKELGELIRGARLQREVSLDQAAADTRIRRQYLDAIEDGDFNVFPGSAYATGFLRNYATYLGLNADDILQTYHTLTPPALISIEPATTVGVERLRRKSRRRLGWVFAAIILVFLGAAAVNKYHEEQVRGPAAAPQLPISTSGLTSDHHLTAHHSPSRHPSHSLSTRRHAAVAIRAFRPTWVHVMINHKAVFWGAIPTNGYRRWIGPSVTVRTRHGESLRTWVDGYRLGPMNPGAGLTVLVAKPHGWHRLR